jgi:hypothetical protein
MNKKLLATASLALLIGGCATPTNSSPETPSASPSATLTYHSPTWNDGMWIVPDQMPPGKYQTVGTEYGCYWERLSAADGQFNSIISNGNVPPNGPAIVEIKATDKFFKTERGCSWTPLAP